MTHHFKHTLPAIFKQAESTQIPSRRKAEGWWRWDVPGQDDPLCLLQPSWPEVQHRIRDSLRHHALRALERPRTFGGLGGAVDREACRHGLAVAKSELEASLLRGLMTGATWTSERAAQCDHRCPYCVALEGDKLHALWACWEWVLVRDPWVPWVTRAASVLPRLGPMAAWPPCLHKAGLLPALAAEGADREAVHDAMRRLYGTFLAVLTAWLH